MPPTDTAKAASRRELNKVATRRAIADAALALLRSEGAGNFTVEDIASEAGVSRRTFFNYFTGVDAALASLADRFLDNVLDEFRLRPADEPILESARVALMELADPMTAAPIAELFSLTNSSQALGRCELEAWEHCTEQIIAAARERLGEGADELHLRAMAGSIIACGKAAMGVWFEERGADLSPESLAVFRQHLVTAVGLLASGFNSSGTTA